MKTFSILTLTALLVVGLRSSAADQTQQTPALKPASADIEPAEVAKVQKKLDTARVRLAKQDNATGATKPE